MSTGLLSRHFPTLCALLFLAHTGLCVASDDPIPPDLDTFIKEGMNNWQQPGLAIAVVKDGRPVLLKGYGVREFGKEESVDEDTLFAIGSASKAFTAAALGILVDRKLTRWESRVHDLAPEVTFSDPWVTSEIRLSDLPANHSGLSGVSEALWYGTGFTRSEILDRLEAVPVSEGFRYHFQYRNVMFLLAGEMIPRITGGTTWDEFIQSEIFNPLGMQRSQPTESGLDGKSNVARPHVLNYRGEPMVVPYRDMHNIAPAGSIISSVRDLVPWMKVHLSQNDPPLLSPETLRFLHSPMTPMWSIGPGGEIRMPQRPFQSYCLGWVTESYHGTRLVWHNGNIDGMSAWVAMAPDLGLGVAILSNMDDSELRTSIFFHILDHVLGRQDEDIGARLLAARKAALQRRDETEVLWQKLAQSPLNAALPLEKYTGTYSSPLLGKVTIQKADGRLLYVRTAQQSLELVVEGQGANAFLGRHTNSIEDLRTGKVNVSFVVRDGLVLEMRESADGVPIAFQRVN